MFTMPTNHGRKYQYHENHANRENRTEDQVWGRNLNLSSVLIKFN